MSLRRRLVIAGIGGTIKTARTLGLDVPPDLLALTNDTID